VLFTDKTSLKPPSSANNPLLSWAVELGLSLRGRGGTHLQSAGEELPGISEVKCIEMQAFNDMNDLNQHTFTSTGKMIK
jgi:hypothetical protein